MSHEQTLPAPLRVCHVFCETKGAVWMVEQLRELRNRYGYDVCAVISGTEGLLADRLRAERIPFHATDFVYSLRQTHELKRAVLSLVHFFQMQRFDVVQTHIFRAAVVTRPAAWIADVPVQLAMVSGPYHLEAQTSRWLERGTSWMETALIPSCQKSLDLYRAMGIAPDRLALIYYGADTQTFDSARTPRAGIRAEYGWPEGTPVVALVAWFYLRPPPSPWWPTELHNRGGKGHEDFVRAAPFILKDFPNTKFLVVGGPFDEGGKVYMEQVQWLVRCMNLQDTVIFLGHRSDINQILRDVDVEVQASLNENLGGTIEALLMECPTVATRVGGMVDTVRDGETGVLVNPSNPVDLARGILELLRNPERARRLGRAGRTLVMDRMSLDRTVEQLHDLYIRLLRHRKHGRRSYRTWVSFFRRALLPAICASCAAIERISGWSFERRQSLHSLDSLDDLRAQNPPGDIVDMESVTRLWSDDNTPRNGVFLGRGWHPLERDGDGPFRWLGDGGELVITHPDGEARSLILDAESGPGQRGQPFQLRISDQWGSILDRATVSGRRKITFKIRLAAAERTVLRLRVPRGVRIPTDVRILNLRVRRVSWQRPLFADLEELRALNQPEDIAAAESLAQCRPGDDLPANGIFLGRGWYGLERDPEGPFRWLQSEGEIVITCPDGGKRRIVLDVHSGPGQKNQPFELRLVDGRGIALDTAVVSSRREVTMTVHLKKAKGVILRLIAPEGIPIPTDDRILNVGVRRISWGQTPRSE